MINPQDVEEKKQRQVEVKSRVQLMQNGLSQRLQSENPFEEFRKAVEQAVIEKQVTKEKEYEGDQDFFKDEEDIGMCMSMH